MIQQKDRELLAWIKQVLPEQEVILGSPHLLEGKQGISLYLLALAAPSSVGTHRPSAMQIVLRYLITVWEIYDIQVHLLLERLITDVLTNPTHRFEVDFTALPDTLWLALGVAPRPALVLTLQVLVEKPQAPFPVIRHPLDIQFMQSTRKLEGKVYGPDPQMPIVGARIELPALHLNSSTDVHGYFSFDLMEPVEAPAPDTVDCFEILIKYKGQTWPRSITPGELLTFDIDILPESK